MMMTKEERLYLEERIKVLKNQMQDTTNRIKILLEKRKDLNKQSKGFRARIERGRMEEVSDW